MKILINADYGGFNLSEDFLNTIEGICPADRANPRLIKAVEEYGLSEAGGRFADLAIVEIPDEATDWDIDEYDGFETIIYVLDGKIKYKQADRDYA